MDKFFFSLILSFFLNFSHAAIVGNDDRVSTDGASFSSVGLVKAKLEGTGFIIGKKVVLTAAHVVAGDSGDIYFFPGSTNRSSETQDIEAPFGGFLVKEVVFSKKWKENCLGQSEEIINSISCQVDDFAFLILENELTEGLVNFEFSNFKEAQSINLKLVGYGRPNAHVQKVNPNICRFESFLWDKLKKVFVVRSHHEDMENSVAPLVITDCDVTEGNSGTPVFFQTENGDFKVVGMVISASEGHGLSWPVRPTETDMPLHGQNYFQHVLNNGNMIIPLESVKTEFSLLLVD